VTADRVVDDHLRRRRARRSGRRSVAAQPRWWRRRTQVVAIDPSASFRSAICRCSARPCECAPLSTGQAHQRHVHRRPSAGVVGPEPALRPQARSRVGSPTAPAARRVSPRLRNRWARRPLRGRSGGAAAAGGDGICWDVADSPANGTGFARPGNSRKRQELPSSSADGLPDGGGHPPGAGPRYVTCTGVSDPRCLRRRTLRRRSAFAARVRSPRSIPARYPAPGAGGGMGSISTKDITVPSGHACAPPSGLCSPPPASNL
jgi:hypothetical protein